MGLDITAYRQLREQPDVDIEDGIPVENGYMDEAFMKLCDLAHALGASPMTKHAGCWEHRLDERWEIAINGHDEPKRCSHCVTVEPFHCYVQYNGWPAGMFSPYGGYIAAGKCANEDEFLAAIDRAIRGLEGKE